MNSLRELARKGRNLQQRRRDQQRQADSQARAARATYRQEAIRLSLGMSLTRWGFLSIFDNNILWLSALAGVGVASIVAFTTTSTAAICGAAFGVALGCGAPLAGRWYVRFLLNREITWIHALPFVVVGYPDLLGWKAYSSVTLALYFEHTPDTALVTQALNEPGMPVTLRKVADQRVELEVENPKGSKFDGQRRWFRRWLHRVEPACRALDQEFGLAAIYFCPSATEADDWQPDIVR